MTALSTEDPAVAAAMGRCLLARSLKVRDQAFRPTLRHPRECGWCPYPLDELQAAVIEFNNWAEFDDVHRTSGRHRTRTFTELRPADQEALITAAQALVDEAPPEPEPVPPPAPPAADAEEEISWLS